MSQKLELFGTSPGLRSLALGWSWDGGGNRSEDRRLTFEKNLGLRHIEKVSDRYSADPNSVRL
jgi:hypothetical protein